MGQTLKCLSEVLEEDRESGLDTAVAKIKLE